MPDFFPSRGAELLEWFKNFSKVLMDNATAWNIATDVVSSLSTQVSAYETAYEMANGDSGTKALILERNERRNALKATIRSIKNKYIDYNDAITDANRERLGLPIRDRKPTHKPKPVSRPSLEVMPTNNRQHTVVAINQATGNKTKPDDAYGMRYVWEIRDTAPANASELRYSLFRRKTTEVFDYNEEDRGKRIYYAACYENAKGEAGPWSNLVEAIIP